MSMSSLFTSGNGRPARCRCKRMVVSDLTETLACPARWYAVQGIGWVHVIGGAR